MSIVNQACLLLARTGLAVYQDNRVGGPTNVQATAQPLTSMLTRVTTPNGAGASFILPNVAAARSEMRVVNDCGVSITVYCASGENHNGTLNGSLSIANGQTGIFWPVFPEIQTAGPDWRSTTLS